MCNTDQPQETEPAANIQTFDSTAEFLDALKPGMELCTSDFTGWADIESVQAPTGDNPGFVVGRVRESGALVHVPAAVLIDIRGGHCIRMDRVRATVNNQGWEVG